MKRLLTIFVGLCVFYSALFATTSQAMERFVAGVHYKIVAPEPSKTPTPHVYSFFSYACPHCNHLEPAVDKWRATLASDVRFERVPAQWSKSFAETARFYYALEGLQLADKYSMAVFDAIHQKKRSLHTEGVMITFAQSLGIDKQQFQQALQDAAIDKKMRKGKGLLEQYKIPGVPSFVVNGRYFVNISLAGSPEELFLVLDYLLSKR